MTLTAVRILTALAILGPAVCFIVWGLFSKSSCCGSDSCKKKFKKDQCNSDPSVNDKANCKKIKPEDTDIGNQC